MNGVIGGLFTDKTNYNSIFLPAVGTRDCVGTLVNTNLKGVCWGNTASSGYGLCFVFAGSTPPTVSASSLCGGFSIRPVKDDSTGINDVSADTENAKVTGYFDILGRKLTEEPTKGLYIIQYDNGKTKKMVK